MPAKAMNDNSFDSELSNDSTTAVHSNSPAPDQAMDLSNAVVNHNHNHSNSNSNGNGNGYIGMDEDEEADPNVAIAEQVNHLEAILQPTIDLLEQMKYVFDRIKRQKEEIDKSAQLLCWESDQLELAIQRNQAIQPENE